MMFHSTAYNNIALVGEWIPPGQLVNRLRGVLTKDTRMISRVCPYEF